MARFVQLISAIINDDMTELSSLVATTPETELNASLLRSIILTEDTRVTDILLDAGANVNHQDKDGRTALFLAVKYNEQATVEKLIERGCSVNLGKYNYSNALHLAARKGNADISRILIDAGHELNLVNWGGNTALLIGCRFGHRDVVEALVHAGADVNICNKLGHYPLHYAAFAGDSCLVELLMDIGANPNVKTHLGITAMMLACERKQCSVVKILAPLCDLRHREQLYGGTVLHWAVASGCANCVEFLVSQGGDLYMLDSSGRSALIQAIQSDQPHILEYLIKKHPPCDFDMMTNGINSCCVHLAAYLGHRECLMILLMEVGVQPLVHKRDCCGHLPLDLAIIGVHKELAMLLLGYGIHSRCVTDPQVQPSSIIDKKPTCSLVNVSDVDSCKANRRGEENCSSSATVSGISSVVQSLARSGIDPGGGYPLFKTYSPVKMAMIDMLRSASGEQMVAPVKFNFNTWLDKGPEAFVLKVTSLDLTDWIHDRMHTPWSLVELCRGCVRRYLGYRASEKVSCLPVPPPLKHYLNMCELDEVETSQIQIRSTRAFDDIDAE